MGAYINKRDCLSIELRRITRKCVIQRNVDTPGRTDITVYDFAYTDTVYCIRISRALAYNFETALAKHVLYVVSL